MVVSYSAGRGECISVINALKLTIFKKERIDCLVSHKEKKGNEGGKIKCL